MTSFTVHFTYGEAIVAIIYGHADGYPEGAGVGLRRFIAETGKLKSSRWDDPAYLAARYVVFLADSKGSLDFLGVGVQMNDQNAEFTYVVDCAPQPPTITCYQDGKEIPIP